MLLSCYISRDATSLRSNYIAHCKSFNWVSSKNRLSYWHMDEGHNKSKGVQDKVQCCAALSPKG